MVENLLSIEMRELFWSQVRVSDPPPLWPELCRCPAHLHGPQHVPEHRPLLPLVHFGPVLIAVCRQGPQHLGQRLHVLVKEVLREHAGLVPGASARVLWSWPVHVAEAQQCCPEHKPRAASPIGAHKHFHSHAGFNQQCWPQDGRSHSATKVPSQAWPGTPERLLLLPPTELGLRAGGVGHTRIDSSRPSRPYIPRRPQIHSQAKQREEPFKAPGL